MNKHKSFAAVGAVLLLSATVALGAPQLSLRMQENKLFGSAQEADSISAAAKPQSAHNYVSLVADKLSRYGTEKIETILDEKQSGTVSYEYDFRGNRTKMTDSTGVTAFSYFPLSELVSETHGDISKSYSYDKNSARTVFTLSKGGTNEISYRHPTSPDRLIGTGQEYGY